VGGVWLLVAAYAILHYQFIVIINPEHFAVHHPNYFNILHPSLRAAVCAFLASIGPGIFLGVLLYFAARYGNALQISPGRVLAGTICMIFITEICAISTGLYVFQTGRLIYPDACYPSLALTMTTTQTIQITAYLAGAVFSALLIMYVIYKRITTRP
jgi:hypothetical protein